MMDQLAVPFAFAIPSIAANRLVTSIRISHYADRSDVETYLPTLRFNVDTSPPTTHSANLSISQTIQYEIFDERTGI